MLLVADGMREKQIKARCHVCFNKIKLYVVSTALVTSLHKNTWSDTFQMLVALHFGPFLCSRI